MRSRQRGRLEAFDGVKRALHITRTEARYFRQRTKCSQFCGYDEVDDFTCDHRFLFAICVMRPTFY